MGITMFVINVVLRERELISESNEQTKIHKDNFLLRNLYSKVTKPDFIFGESNDLNKKDGVNGFINITLSILCNAIAIFAHKKIANNFNNYTFNIFFGINFILFSFFLMILDKFTILHLDIFTLLMLFLMSILFNINQTLFNLSTKLGDLVVILPITYLCIVLGFINNIIFFNGAWDYLDLLGSFGIIFINVCRIIFTFNEE